MADITVVIQSEDREYDFDQLDLTFESSDEEIIEALQPVVLEDTGFNIKEEDGTTLFTVHKAENSGKITVYPKSAAGT